ncbi:hypothetical protein NQ314_013530 [Rhamnusium bicolor]|uniref:Uncharacterized protein n=1 Tax=Rhamnusium bicolor TaxID=1586634 RepID=A0AAV8X5Y3_9CUCU|nr:hypothetical protein NQ314_013530 [Rhamnusium bicolor]
MQGDDIWISSEDLRTEGSSDEDTQHKSCGNKRSKKQRKSDLLLSTTNNPSPFFSKSSDSVNVPAKHIGDSSNEKSDNPTEKSTFEQNIDFNMEHSSVTGNPPFLPDVFLESAPSTSGISLGSSDSDMDALNLESRWRPKRGSLKYPILVEGTSVEV